MALATENQVILPAPPASIRPAPETTLAARGSEIPPAGCPKLSEALALARDRCKAATKDKVNLHHNFAYASADEVIDTASVALAGSGLALIPMREELQVVGSGSLAFYALKRSVVLTHSSGEFVTLEVLNWPVVLERGRPLDKAYAIALTTSLAYKLRDLLQMPRGTDDDVAAQDDRKTPVVPVDATPTPDGIDPQAPIGTPQVDRIAALVERLGLSWEALNARLQVNYAVGTVRGLKARQADEVERLLEGKWVAKRGSES